MGHDLGIEKSRDMGASWMVLYVFLWFWIFRENSDFKMGSWREDYVDEIGNMDTLFGKLRFAMQFIPGWMLPPGYIEKKHSTFCKLVNPKNGNTISGEAPTVHFGSGGRRKAVFLDEYSKWDPKAASSAWTATADVTKCRVVVGTPYGSGNKYAELMLGTASKEKIKKLTLHWTLHPEKAQGVYYLDADGSPIPIKSRRAAFDIWFENRQEKDAIVVRSPWYDAECERRSDADVAQELDIDYLKSGAPFFKINMVNKQKEWKHMVRQNPFSRIPYGFFVTGKIVLMNYKHTFIEDQQENWLNIYELPLPYREYILCGDTSEGLAKGDWSFAVIRDKYTHNVVATIKGLYEPDIFEEYCFLAAKFYGDCLCAIESYPSAYGYAVNRGIQKRGANMYYAKRYETNKGDAETPKSGVVMDNKFRPTMLTKAEEGIRRRRSEVRDADIIAQMRTFIRNPKKAGRPEADGQMHDDGVIAYSIFEIVVEENPFNPVRQNDTMHVNQQTPNGSGGTPRRKNAGFGFG